MCVPPSAHTDVSLLKLISLLQPLNQVVVWDSIIRKKADARIQTKANINKYGFREVSKSFR